MGDADHLRRLQRHLATAPQMVNPNTPVADGSDGPSSQQPLSKNIVANQPGFTDATDKKRPGGDTEDEPCYVCNKTTAFGSNKLYLCDADCGWGAHHKCLHLGPKDKPPDPWFCSMGCENDFLSKKAKKAAPPPPKQQPAPATQDKKRKSATKAAPPAPTSAPPAAAAPAAAAAAAAAPSSSGGDGGANGNGEPKSKKKKKAANDSQSGGAGQAPAPPAAPAADAAGPSAAAPAGALSAGVPVLPMALPSPIFSEDKVTAGSRMAILHALARLLQHLNHPEAVHPLVQTFRQFEGTKEGMHQVTYHYMEVMLCWEVQDIPGVLQVFRERYNMPI